jgi:hypothetical protein
VPRSGPSAKIGVRRPFRLSAFVSLAGAGADQVPLELGAAAEDGQLREITRETGRVFSVEFRTVE